jgi:hypothetical protein
VTAGLPDLLHIGNQSRPDIFDLRITSPDALYEAVVEVDEAVMLPLGSEPSPRNGPTPQLNARWAEGIGRQRIVDMLPTAVLASALALSTCLCCLALSTCLCAHMACYISTKMLVDLRVRYVAPAAAAAAVGSIACPGKRVVGTTGEEVCVRREPDLQRLRRDLQVRWGGYVCRGGGGEGALHLGHDVFMSSAQLTSARWCVEVQAAGRCCSLWIHASVSSSACSCPGSHPTLWLHHAGLPHAS